MSFICICGSSGNAYNAALGSQVAQNAVENNFLGTLDQQKLEESRRRINNREATPEDAWIVIRSNELDQKGGER